MTWNPTRRVAVLVLLVCVCASASLPAVMAAPPTGGSGSGDGSPRDPEPVGPSGTATPEPGTPVPPEPTPTATPEGTPAGTATPTNGANNSSGGVFGGLSWPDVQITPPEIIEKAISTAAKPVFTFAWGIPQIDIGLADGQPGVHAPQNWPLSNPVLQGLYLLFAGLTVATSLGLICVGVIKLAVGGSSTYDAMELIGRGVMSVIVAGLLHLVLIAVVYRLGNMLAKAFAPNAEMLNASVGSLFQFSVSSAFIIGSFAELGWEFLKWMAIIYGAVYLYLLFFPVLSGPVFSARIIRPAASSGQVSGFLITLWVYLVASKVLAAILIRVSLSLDWGANLPGVAAAAVSLACVFIAAILPPAAFVVAVLNSSRLMSSSMSLGAGAVAGSTLAAGARWGKEKVPETGAKEKATQGAKRAGVKAQSKYWDAKRRVRAGATAATGNVKGAAAQRLGDKFGDDDPAADSGSESSVTPAERMRNLEESAERAGGATATQRKRYMWQYLESDGALPGDSETTQSDD